MGTTRKRAEWYAANIVCLLQRKTGRDYEVKTYSMDKLKYLEIREPNEDGTYDLIIYYTAKTWVGICNRIHAAYNTHLTIQEA